MFGLIKKFFLELLINIINASNHPKYVSLSNQECDLDSNEYSHEFHYCLFTVKLKKCVKSCNTLNDLSNKVSAPNKTEDLNLNVFNMNPGINESKTLAKHLSFEYKCKFDGRRYNADQWWNNDKCQCECKKRQVCEKDYVWNPATCNCENGKYLESIMDDSAIICDDIVEYAMTEQILMKRKQPVKLKISIFYLHFC